MNSLEYWKECIAIAAEECGLTINAEQLDCLAGSVEGGHDNYNMYSGNEVADRNFISDDKRELDRIKTEQEKHRQWELRTEPCKACTTTGTVRDGWGRNQTCSWCNGKGRH